MKQVLIEEKDRFIKTEDDSLLELSSQQKPRLTMFIVLRNTVNF